MDLHTNIANRSTQEYEQNPIQTRTATVALQQSEPFQARFAKLVCTTVKTLQWPGGMGRSRFEQSY